MNTVSYLDPDVNLHTVNRRGQWQTRETDGRFVRKNFGGLKKISAESQKRAADWDKQMAEDGDILWA